MADTAGIAEYNDLPSRVGASLDGAIVRKDIAFDCRRYWGWGAGALVTDFDPLQAMDAHVRRCRPRVCRSHALTTPWTRACACCRAASSMRSVRRTPPSQTRRGCRRATPSAAAPGSPLARASPACTTFSTRSRRSSPRCGRLAVSVLALRVLNGPRRQGHRRISPYMIPNALVNMAAGHVGLKYGLQGPTHAVSTACATGAHAIGERCASFAPFSFSSFFSLFFYCCFFVGM
jgi:hypothetical protein